MKTIQLFTIAALIMTGSYAAAQSSGTIKGTVTDAKGSPLMFATVALMEDSVLITGAQTDDNGDYTIKQITPGEYTLKFIYAGYATKVIKNVYVDPTQVAYVSTKMAETSRELATVEITETFTQSIINPTYSTITAIKVDQIDHMPASRGDIVAIVTAVTPGVMPTDDGKDLYVRGSRRGSTQYIIDGNKVMGSAEVPGPGIAGMEVLTGGVPAEYGDCTGGIVIITTKDYKWEMRRKEMERREREEAEQRAKKEKQAAAEKAKEVKATEVIIQ